MAKTRKNAVPKRIAGMKVPKALRRGRVGQLLATPVGQALIIDMVARAGEHLISHEAGPGSAVRKTAARSQAAAADLGQSGGQGAAESSAAFVYALRQAARAFVNAMQEQQQLAAQGEGGREHEPGQAGREEERLEKKDRGERPDRRTAH